MSKFFSRYISSKGMDLLAPNLNLLEKEAPNLNKLEKAYNT